jgi:hypothetical protein
MNTKWRVLDFTPLLSSALKRELRIVAIRGILTADCHKQNYRTADCHRQKSKFERGLPQASTGCMYFLLPERAAWQSAVHLREKNAKFRENRDTFRKSVRFCNRPKKCFLSNPNQNNHC